MSNSQGGDQSDGQSDDQRALKRVRSLKLPSCEASLIAARATLLPQLTHEHIGLQQSISALGTSAWMPRAPQLRGRVDRDQRAGSTAEWFHRVGARLYLPALTADPDEVTRLGVSLDELPDAWRDARLREETARVSVLHVTAREAWVGLVAARERAQINAKRYQLSTDLERSGALSTRDLRRARLKSELARLEARDALERWGALSAEVLEATPSAHIEPSDLTLTPLESTCATRPTSPEVFKQRPREPRALSAQEALLLLELNQRSADVARGERRWLDFVEISYDQRGDDSRWIAEIGVDIAPLDPRDASERLRRDQLRADLRARLRESAQAERRLWAQLNLIYAEGAPRAASVTLERPELKQLPDLELYELEVTLWERSWRRALSAERALIAWRALRGAD